MKYFTYFSFILGIVFIVPTACANVVINEVFPKTTDRSQNWVELYNNGSTPVSLNQWKLEHTEGNATAFILNASAIIEPHGFLTFTGSQTGMTFSIEGDIIRLSDEKNELVDSQRYPGNLGYNTAMGRRADGTWAICPTGTFNTQNDCPQPSPTATPVPTSTPTPTPTPMNTPVPPSPTLQTTSTRIPTQIPTVAQIPTLMEDDTNIHVSKNTLAYFLLGIAAAAGATMLYLWLMRKRLPPHG